MTTNRRDIQDELTQDEIMQIILATSAKQQEAKSGDDASSKTKSNTLSNTESKTSNEPNIQTNINTGINTNIDTNIENFVEEGIDNDVDNDIDNRTLSLFEANLQHFFDNLHMNNVNPVNTQTNNSTECSKETKTVDKPKVPPTRCEFAGCKRKLHILSLECRCGLMFCDKHKFFTDHPCSYDYKGEYAKILKERNQKIEKEKVVKL